jgi:hypothetical protein
MSLQFLEETCGFGGNMLVLSFREFSEQFLLSDTQPGRRLNRDLHELVAGSVSSDVRQTLAFYSENASILSPGRHSQLLGSIDAGYVNGRPQSRLRETYRNNRNQVISITL